MSINQTFNGIVYPIPTQGDLNWGPNATRYWVALGSFALAPSGGLFTLTNDVNLGPSFGILGPYFSGRGLVASSGLLRLSKTDTVAWKNNGGSGNNVLATDSGDNLTWNGTPLLTGTPTLADGTIWIGNSSNIATSRTLTGDITTTNTGVTSITADVITNNDVNSAAAIAYSKLNLFGSITNTDIDSAASIAYSKLALSNSILNADINTSAAIDASKIANGTVSSAEFQYLDGVTSAIQTQLDGKQASGSYLTALTGDATASGPGSAALTLATVNSNVGSFTSANITVNAKGLVTAASNGTGGVTSITGTANQVIASASTGAVTLSTPQNIGTASTPTFGGLTIGSTPGTITMPLNGTISSASAWSIGSAASLILSGSPLQVNSDMAMISHNITGLAAATTAGQAVRYEQAILTSGANAFAADQSMGSHKITSLTSGTASTDAAAFGQIYCGFQAAVQATTATGSTTTSVTFQNTALTASITPTSSSHRIKVTATFTGSADSSGNSALFTIKRDSTNLGGTAGFVAINVATTLNITPGSITYIDSPATTSSTTYTLQMASANNSGTVEFMPAGNQKAVIILEEIV